MVSARKNSKGVLMLQGQKLQKAYEDYVIIYSARKRLNPKTIRNKRHMLDKLLPFLNGKPFIAETANEYAQFMFEHGWKEPNSQLNIIKNLRAFVNFLFDYDYIEKNFAKKLIRPKVAVVPEPLPTMDQAEAVIMAGTEPGKADHSYHKERKSLMRFALQFALRTGLRGNELINIRGKDLFIDEIDPHSSKVYITEAKGGIPQWQPLPFDMLEELKNHITDEKVFPVAIKTCNIVLRRGAVAIGLPSGIDMHVHILRKVFGTTLARSLTMSKVSALMRHSSISVTQKFYITYGLNELGQDLNMNHPLIRIAMPPEQDIREFIHKMVYPHFERSGHIKIKHVHDPDAQKFVLEITY